MKKSRFLLIDTSVRKKERKGMSDSGKKWGTASIDSNGKTATVFLEEYVPAEGSMPEQSIVGHCNWNDRHSAENTVNSFLRAKSYPTDRCMTEAEVEEVRQTMRQTGY